jgi:hypothetical protein
MQTLPRIDEYVATDIQLRATFSSDPITLDDAAALFQLLQTLMESVQREMTQQTGEEVYLLPVVTVSGGSIEAKIEIKMGPATVELKGKLREIFLGAMFALNPGNWGLAVTPQPPTPPPVVQCHDDIVQAAYQAEEIWRRTGKGYRAEFHATCGGTTIISKIDVPPGSKRK